MLQNCFWLTVPLNSHRQNITLTLTLPYQTLLQSLHKKRTWLIGDFGDSSSPAHPPGKIVSEFPNKMSATAAAQSSPAPSLKDTPNERTFVRGVTVGFD